MKSFEEWWKDWSGTNLLPENTDINYAFQAGQQSKQAEIDELRKRIDEAVELMTMLNDDNTVRFMKKPMLKILKGNTNDH